MKQRLHIEETVLQTNNQKWNGTEMNYATVNQCLGKTALKWMHHTFGTVHTAYQSIIETKSKA